VEPIHSDAPSSGVSGYAHCEHPRGADLTIWKDNIQSAITDYWQDKVLWTDEGRKSFMSPNSQYVTDEEVSFSIVISSQRLISTEDGKTISTDGIQATVPVTQAAAVQLLIDGALEHKCTHIMDFIPAGLRRENPGMYHSLLNSHAEFMHLHHKIQLLNVTATDLDLEVDGKSLREHLLEKSPAVQALPHDSATDRAHITISKIHFPALCQWIDTELLCMTFPFVMSHLSAAKPSRPNKSSTAK
jgi:hypothetical protein